MSRDVSSPEMPLEVIARAAWIASVDAPGEMQELVALGFIQADDVVWYQLENVAEPNPDGRGEFFVDGSEVAQCMNRAYMELDGAWDGIVLWHTHTATVSPSAEDIAEFPEWLAQVGMVYHVPSGRSTLYNSAGVISNSHGAVPPLATVSDG